MYKKYSADEIKELKEKHGSFYEMVIYGITPEFIENDELRKAWTVLTKLIQTQASQEQIINQILSKLEE